MIVDEVEREVSLLEVDMIVNDNILFQKYVGRYRKI